MPHPITEKLIQRQINHWHEFRKYLVSERHPLPKPKPPVITVSRLAGSGGRELAEELSARLDLPLHDRSLVEQVMRQENLPPALAAELDEQAVSQTSLWVKGLFHRRIFLVREYEAALTRVITSLAASVGGVFLGRGAHLVLGQEADLRLRVVAGSRTRLQRLQQRFNLSRAEARVLRDETDHVRQDFLAKVFGRTAPGSRQFDMTINCDRLTPGDGAELALLAWTTTTHGKSRLNRAAAHS